jgi:hypothetical protein
MKSLLQTKAWTVGRSSATGSCWLGSKYECKRSYINMYWCNKFRRELHKATKRKTIKASVSWQECTSTRAKQQKLFPLQNTLLSGRHDLSGCGLIPYKAKQQEIVSMRIVDAGTGGFRLKVTQKVRDVSKSLLRQWRN